MPAEQEQELAVALGADPEAAQHASLVVLVGDAEAAPEAGSRGVLPKQSEAQSMQGAPGDILGEGPDLALQSRGDLVGGLVGEGDGANAARVQPVPGDQPRDARDETVRLARAGPGDDQDRAERGLDGLALGGRRLEAQATLEC
jgi:hypothetical protein